MTDLLIRGLNPHTHAELKRRAERAGMSVQAYVSQLLDQHIVPPSLHEWLRRLDAQPRHPEIDAAAAVRAARDELP